MLHVLCVSLFLFAFTIDLAYKIYFHLALDVSMEAYREKAFFTEPCHDSCELKIDLELGIAVKK